MMTQQVGDYTAFTMGGLPMEKGNLDGVSGHG
jgi:hypothetical protein